MSILQLCEESESEYEGEKMGLDLIQLRLNKKKKWRTPSNMSMTSSHH